MSRRILALDTTAEFGSVALAGEELPLHEPDGYGAIVFQRIEELLALTGLRLEDVDAFAAASGPGSFTGVRIGLACVKGLAEALDKPAFAVSNLEALARFGSGALRAPLIDARRKEVYAALYDAAGALVIPETVCHLQEFLDRLPAGPVEFIARSAEAFAPQPVTLAPMSLAGMIGKIAAERLAAGVRTDPASLDANYVRRSDAELQFKPW